MERQKPENADFYAWDEFEKWADKKGIGDHKEYWEDWWDCWQSGYIVGVNAL